MSNPLPVREIRGIVGGEGFLHLYGRDQYVYLSDAVRRASGDTIARILNTLRERGFDARIGPSNLLLIDLSPARWKALLDTFREAVCVPFPENEGLQGVYALARLLERHPADFELQPMEPIRAVLKQYGRKGGLPALAPPLAQRCAEKLRRGESLPSLLAKVLYAWLSEQPQEVLT